MNSKRLRLTTVTLLVDEHKHKAVRVVLASVGVRRAILSMSMLERHMLAPVISPADEASRLLEQVQSEQPCANVEDSDMLLGA